MLEYDRIYISEGIVINRTSALIFTTIGIF